MILIWNTQLDDANYQADPAAQTNAVCARLPAFLPANAKVWFILAEAQFTIRGISQDATKHAHVMAALDERPTVCCNYFGKPLRYTEGPPPATFFNSQNRSVHAAYIQLNYTTTSNDFARTVQDYPESLKHGVRHYITTAHAACHPKSLH